MSTLPPVFVEFMASAAGFRTAAAEVRGEITRVETAGGGTFAKVSSAGTKAFALIGAAAAVAAVKSVAMAGDWQQSITRLGTAAGESKNNLAMVSAGLLQIARDTGTSTRDLASGMYMVESAGFHGADGLKVMRAAAEGAKVENADLGSVSNALTTVMKDMHAPVSSAATVMSQMVAAVRQGKMTMDDLAGSIHSVLPNASALGISFPQVAGALATMTAQGISADQAAQNLNHTIVKLASPTAAMTKTMSEYGLTSSDVAKQLGSKGLTGTFAELSTAILQKMGPAGTTLLNSMNQSRVASQDLQLMFAKLPAAMQTLATQFESGQIGVKDFRKAIQSFGGPAGAMGLQFLSLYKTSQGFNTELTSGKPAAQTFSAAMKGMLGDQTGLQVALHLTGKATGDFNDSVKKIASASAEAGGHVQDWGTVQKNFNLQMAKLKEVVQTAMIEIGTKLLPVVQAIIGWFSKHITVAKDVILGLIALAAAFAAARLAMMVGNGVMKLWELGTKAVAAAQWLLNAALDANPVVLITLAIAALAAGLVYAYEHSKTFRDIVNDIGSVFAWVWHNVLEPVVNFFVHNWKVALGVAVAVVAPFVALPLIIIKYWRQILTWFENLPGVIFGYLKDAGRWLLGIGKAIIVGLWNGIYSIWNTQVRWLENFGSMVWGFFKDAGSWLFNVGAAIFQGLWNGIKQVWNNMTGWLGSVGGWISHLKGPIEKDAVLLTPHGKAIMNGLHTGLKAGWKDVKSGLQGMSAELGSMQFASPTASLGVAGAAGGVVNINLTVQGSVQTENDLVSTIETAMLRRGARRGQTYVNYKR